MSNNTTQVIYKPVSFLTLLGVAFIVLKFCNVITWSWWWVTLPIWGGWALVAAILVIVAIIGISYAIIKG